MISLTSCKGGKVGHDTYRQIYNKYSNINSFTAEAKINIKSNLTSNTYTVKQYYLAPDNYKMEIISPKDLSGAGYCFSGGRVSITGDYGNIFSIEDYVPEDRSYVFINDFFEGYYKSEDTFIETSKSNLKGECTVLKNVLSHKNPYRYSQCAFINNSDYFPQKLVTYDMDNNEVITVTYEKITFNEKIDKEVFKDK